MANLKPHTEATKSLISNRCIGTHITKPERTEFQRERDRLKMRRWRLKNPEREKASRRNWAAKNKDKIRGYNLRIRLGITATDWAEMFSKQNGLCALCDKPAKVTDHCHTTGRVRGLLCIRCNTKLGFYEEFNRDKRWCEKAVGYLLLL